MSVGTTTSLARREIARDRLPRRDVIARARPRPPGRGRRDPSSFETRRSRARREDRERARRRPPRPRARARRPGRSTASAPRATASVAPSPTSAIARLPVAHLGLERSISSSRTYGGFDTTRSQGPSGKPVETGRRERSRRRVRFGPRSRARPRARRPSVDRRDARPRCFVGDRERDRPASGADVENARLGDPVDPRQAALDDDLRLGSRNEHPRVDARRQPAKSPFAEHVRERLAELAAHDQSIELLQRGVVELAAGVRPETAPCRPEHVGEQDLGIDVGATRSRQRRAGR